MGRLVNVGDTVEILNGRYAGAIGRLIQTGFAEPCVVEILIPLIVVEPGDQIKVQPCQMRAVEIVEEEKPKRKKQ